MGSRVVRKKIFARISISCAFSALLMLSCSEHTPENVESELKALPEVIDYNFHVKPILSDKCYACHGPDENTRRANLRLDIEESAFASLEGGGVAINRGRPDNSKLLHRIFSENPSEMMPPPEFKNPLTAKEMAILHKWIDQGADWKPHWSFIPPSLPDVPNGFPKEWKTSNSIDNFINNRIAEAGLEPELRADKERLLRRITMDLTGLPPTIEEIDTFLDDDSPEAYFQIVDRLLQSEHFGERMAMEWMDLARYADSHGMHADGWRLMWPWRDWVIQAFNDNMAYDQFVTWQLAGDLMPDASKEQVLATAFHRNHTMTAEGGAIDEEFRLEYVADRTNTTATAFMGLTMECAKCHDHKFDPISQKEYYQLSAFFNNVKELGMTGDDGNYGPMMLITDDAQDELIAALESEIGALEKEFDLTEADVKSLNSYVNEEELVQVDRGLVGYFPLDESRLVKKENGNDHTVFDKNPTATSNGKPEIVNGKFNNAVELNEDFEELTLSDGVGVFELYEPYSASIWIKTYQNDSSKTQTIMGTSGEKNNFWRGWDFYLDENNQLSIRLIHSFPHNYVHVRSLEAIEVNEWHHLGFTYDGSGSGSGLELFVDGVLAESEIVFDHLYKSIHPVTVATHLPNKSDVRVGRANRLYTGEYGIFQGLMDEIRLYSKVLNRYEMAYLGQSEIEMDPESAAKILVLKKSPSRDRQKNIQKLRKEKLEALADIPEVMIMEEMPVTRPTFIRERGEYNSPSERVFASTPKSVLDFADTLQKNRLGLSQWLFDKKNPLTARVAVNRYWQMIFGAGIVKTANDFGSQGKLPTHPQLLDWLAVEFVNSNWDLKHLIRLMVTSETYCRSSIMTEKTMELDPENSLLARAPSFRWPAEMIRDNALFASGLMARQIGGESVKPYQPEGLWIELGNFSHKLMTYKPDSGEGLYRRSMYTFIRRTSPPPFMTTFDAPNRDVCVIQRERTNTPLQALVLMNDPQFVEAARKLAERSILESGEDLNDMLTSTFRMATSRKPRSGELEILTKFYSEQFDKYSKEASEASELLDVGESAINPGIDRTQLAALTMVANTMLNHDETYMRR